MKLKKLKYSDFISIFLRSFFIQTVHNFKGLLSVGMCFALIPVAKRFYSKKEDYQKFMKRHLCFFNTHPYFSSYALGAIARVEEDISSSEKEADEQIEKFKNALIGPLGAIGDQLFWASIKPAAILVGFTGAFILPTLHLKLIFLAVFLILYNFPHLFTRSMGLVRGYRTGYGIYKLLRIENFKYLNGIYQAIGAVTLGIFSGNFFVTALSADILAGAIFILSGIMAYMVKIKRRTVYWPVIIPLIVTTILGILLS
jgi:mannose/fructose/N-acetylgalactosamine-specific phosphotransferase system component IID